MKWNTIFPSVHTFNAHIIRPPSALDGRHIPSGIHEKENTKTERQKGREIKDAFKTVVVYHFTNSRTISQRWCVADAGDVVVVPFRRRPCHSNRIHTFIFFSLPLHTHCISISQLQMNWSLLFLSFIRRYCSLLTSYEFYGSPVISERQKRQINGNIRWSTFRTRHAKSFRLFHRFHSHHNLMTTERELLNGAIHPNRPSCICIHSKLFDFQQIICRWSRCNVYLHLRCDFWGGIIAIHHHHHRCGTATEWLSIVFVYRTQ